MSPATQIRLAHLLFLAYVATWMGLSQPNGLLTAMVVLAIAASGEALPRGAWREMGSPALVLLAGLIGWLVGDGSHGAIHALLGTLVAALVLVPARPGALRLVAPLAALELVAAGVPSVGVVHPWIAIAAMVPFATLALAADAWMTARLSARSAIAPRFAGLRWAVAPALAAAAIGCLAFVPAERIADAFRQHPIRPGPGGTLPVPTVRSAQNAPIGIEPGGPPPRDPVPAARLFMAHDPGALVYLRLGACSLLNREVATGAWRWTPAPGEWELPTETKPSGVDLGRLVRMGGMGDALLVPDNGGWTDLDGLFCDGDGNRWRPGLGEAIRSYTVALSGPQRREQEVDLVQTRAVCVEVPPGLAGLPWADIENPEWRTLPPTVAGQRIAAKLQGWCSYDLEPPPGDPVQTFLFSTDPKLRRGTCEHFAGAATLLLRRSGHPARCVMGFASSEWDGSSVVFRRLHAHAWTEVLDEDGRWQRVDATPALAFSLRPDVTSPTTLPDVESAVPLAPAGHGRRWLWLTIAAMGTVMFAAVGVLLARRRRRRARRADLQAAHRHRGEELVRLAQDLGLRVSTSDTAAAICRRISARTGVDLARHLAAYEAARFGNGPPPPPWPADEISAKRRPVP